MAVDPGSELGPAYKYGWPSPLVSKRHRWSALPARFVCAYGMETGAVVVKENERRPAPAGGIPTQSAASQARARITKLAAVVSKVAGRAMAVDLVVGSGLELRGPLFRWSLGHLLARDR